MGDDLKEDYFQILNEDEDNYEYQKAEISEKLRVMKMFVMPQR